MTASDPSPVSLRPLPPAAGAHDDVAGTRGPARRLASLVREHPVLRTSTPRTGAGHRKTTLVISIRKNSPSSWRSVPHHQPARTVAGNVTPPSVRSPAKVAPNG